MDVRLESVPTARRIAPLALVCALCVGCGAATDDAFYATADNKLITIEVRDTNNVTVTPVGPIGTDGCASIVRSPSGVLYSVCGSTGKPGPQQLATIDPKTGHATTTGTVVDGLQVMGLEFAPDGTLYTVGDANPASPTFSSLYTVDAKSGALTRIGSTGVSSFFHDFAVDRNGTMYGTTSDALYTIDLKTGTASKVVDFVGGGAIMGLSFNATQDKLYATDFKKPISAVYLVDMRTGFLTPVAATGYPLAHGLVPMNR
jgi:DNA-binding beta-propeller fold protein YncE